MKILFFIDALDEGGAARLISTIANGLSSRGHDVIIAANFQRRVSYDLVYNIECINWYPQKYYQLSKLKRLWEVFKKGRSIIKTKRPDVIVSAVYHIVFLSKLCGLGLGIPFVFSDQTSYARKDSKFVHFIRWHFYKCGDAVTILTDNDRKILGNRLKQKVVIYNPLSLPICEENYEREKVVLAVGHTDRWEVKGLDLLIKSWAKVAHTHPKWTLLILGGDSEKTKDELMQLAKQERVDKSIVFGGFCSDMSKVMQKASLFALSSRIEGFSLVLTEALSQGLPVVSFECKGVIREVSDGGKGVLLVEDGNIKAFAAAMERMMDDRDLRKEKSKEGLLFVKKYSVDKIIPQWESLLQTVVERRRKLKSSNNYN